MGLVGAVLLGRLYGFTAEDALLRVQVGQSLLGSPQYFIRVWWYGSNGVRCRAPRATFKSWHIAIGAQFWG